jgi:two-component system cell cycle sensor histidine kinase/response regulator CckA
MKALIVDDSAVNLKLLRALLATEGIECIDAADGRKALEVLASEPVDCVVTDILMPEMDGYRLCQEIRSSPALRGLPIIVYTATYVSPGDKKLAVEMGADVYMKKPSPAKELGSAIRELIGRPRRGDHTAASEVVLKQYNEALVKKLEERNVQLHEEARKLSISEEKFRQLTDSIQEVFFMTDAGAEQMLYISPAYETIWGRSCQSLYDCPRDWAEAIFEGDRPRVLAYVLEQSSQGLAYQLEYQIVRPDGTRRWIRVRSFPIRDSAGRVYRFAGTAADITEEKRLREQFLHAQKLEAVGKLAGGVAHDFNNLLTVILGLSEMALATLPDGHELREDVAEIKATGDRAAQLTRQLLAFSRRQVFEPKTLAVGDIVNRAERMLARLIGEDIKVRVELAPGLPPARLDPGQMEQVLLNLCVNARDAMPAGGVLTIRTGEECLIRADGEIPPGHYSTLTVADTGLGMDAQVRAHLFEPFFTTKPVGKGTGLGLATCYGIVKQSGGYITVESRPGEGSSFTVHLPAAPAAAAHDEAPAAAPLRGGKETILLVEDDSAVRRLAKRILQEKGYGVVEANDGMHGLELMSKDTGRDISLILTDVVMPLMNGRTLFEEVRRIRPGIKVLFTSGYPDETLSHEGILDSGLAFLRKPYSIASLIERVREVLDSNGQGSA